MKEIEANMDEQLQYEELEERLEMAQALNADVERCTITTGGNEGEVTTP